MYTTFIVSRVMIQTKAIFLFHTLNVALFLVRGRAHICAVTAGVGAGRQVGGQSTPVT